MTTKNKTTSSRISPTIAIGAGIAALAATAAGAYYLYGTKDGKKKQKALKSWTLKMKADVMDEIEHLKEINENLYHAAIDKVASKYKNIKNIDQAEVIELAHRMQKHWKDIRKDLTLGTKVAKNVSKSLKK